MNVMQFCCGWFSNYIPQCLVFASHLSGKLVYTNYVWYFVQINKLKHHYWTNHHHVSLHSDDMRITNYKHVATWIIEWNEEIIARFIWARTLIPNHLDGLIPHSCNLVGHASRGVDDETQCVTSWQPNELGEQTFQIHFLEVFSDPVKIEFRRFHCCTGCLLIIAGEI